MPWILWVCFVIAGIWLKLYILPLVLKWIGLWMSGSGFFSCKHLGGKDLSLLFWLRQHQELIFHRNGWTKTRPRVVSEFIFLYFLCFCKVWVLLVLGLFFRVGWISLFLPVYMLLKKTKTKNNSHRPII